MHLGNEMETRIESRLSTSEEHARRFGAEATEIPAEMVWLGADEGER